MADNAKESGFYEPNAEVAPVRGKPGPKPKVQAAPAPQTPTASALPALEVQAGQPELTADSSIAGVKSDAETLHEDIARIRKIRRPFGAFTQKLALAVRPGYHRHWFNDEPGRVDEASSNGWAHVKDEKTDKPVRRVVGRARDGGPLYAYAMELPKVFWDEDLAARNDAAQARIDEIKKSPFRAKPGQAQASDRDKFYAPDDKVLTMTQTDVRSAPRA